MTNKRQDQWGALLLKTACVLLEIYKAVRAVTSEQFIISVKLNSADFQRGGISEEMSLRHLKLLKMCVAGIDLIEISGLKNKWGS